MKYIKNNKVFIFLFSILLVILLILFYQVFALDKTTSFTQPTDNQSTTAKIANFSGAFNDDRLAIELSWNITTGNKKIDKIMLYCNDKELADVSDQYSISLSQKEYDISTGNNKFDLVVTFTDDSTLSKSKYVYTDEAYAIKISQVNMDTKSVYSITYYYDKRRAVNVPSVQMNGINENFSINYVSTDVISEVGNIVNARCVYELQYNDVKPGNYQVALNFVFAQYNLNKNYTASFQVPSQNTENVPANNNQEEDSKPTTDDTTTETDNGNGDSNDAGNE